MEKNDTDRVIDKMCCGHILAFLLVDTLRLLKLWSIILPRAKRFIHSKIASPRRVVDKIPQERATVIGSD